MKTKIIIFSLFVFFICGRAFSQNYLYVAVTDNSLKPVSTGSILTNNTYLNSTFSTYGVTSYFQSFPGASNTELATFYEIHCTGNVNNLKIALGSFFSTIYISDVYQTAGCTNPWEVNDPLAVNNKALELLDARCAWSVTQGNFLRVGVVDTEFDINHEDLTTPFYNTSTPTTVCGPAHGTGVASCISTNVDNLKGTAAIGYYTFLKGFPSDGEMLWSNIWKASKATGIINVSWVGNGSYPVRLAVQEMISKNTVLVFAAGNSPTTVYHTNYADIPGVIIVSGVDENNIHGNTGHAHNQYVDVCALSKNVIGCVRGGGYAYYTGTSYAAGQVSGVVALVRSMNSSLTPAEIECILKSSAEPIADAGSYPGLLGGGRVNAYKAVCMVTTNYYLVNSTTWTGLKYLNRNLHLETGVTLNIKGGLMCAPGVQIYVYPGASLIVDGCTITSSCSGGLWEGIQVLGDKTKPQSTAYQGKLELKNGAVIENANLAISVGDNWDPNYGGGIISATNATFRNNKQAVQFFPYTYTYSTGFQPNNESSFVLCSFIVDNNNIFSNSFQNHVTLNGVRGVGFSGCQFENNISNLSGSSRGIAINTENAGFGVSEYCPVLVARCSKCPYPTPTRFKGFYRGIQANTTGTQYSVSVSYSKFENNVAGVYINGINNYSITESDFYLPNNTTAYGVMSYNASGYSLRNNIFRKDYSTTGYNGYGIYLSNSGTAENMIKLNEYSYLSYANYVTGTNGVNTSNGTGVQFTCNIFTGNAYDIYSNGIMRPWQGATTLGADNDFNSTGSRSIYSSSQNITYLRSVASNHNPINALSNIAIANATANACPKCDELIFGITQNPPQGTDLYDAISEKYTSLLADSRKTGYDHVLENMNQKTNPFSPETISEAMDYHTQVSSLSQSMAEISKSAITEALESDALDIDNLINWYKRVNTLTANYSLVESYYHAGNYAQADAVLSEIPGIFELSDNEASEYNNYRRFHEFKNQLHRSNKTWSQLDQNEIDYLKDIAEATDGRSASMAQGVLCFFYTICSDPVVESEDNAFAPLQDNQKQSIFNDNRLMVYPNPTNSSIELQLSNTGYKIDRIEIYDVFGKMIKSELIAGSYGKTDLKDLNNAVYLLKAYMSNGEIITKKIVKN